MQPDVAVGARARLRVGARLGESAHNVERGGGGTPQRYHTLTWMSSWSGRSVGASLQQQFHHGGVIPYLWWRKHNLKARFESASSSIYGFKRFNQARSSQVQPRVNLHRPTYRGVHEPCEAGAVVARRGGQVRVSRASSADQSELFISKLPPVDSPKVRPGRDP